jgi:hypothetical protein
MTPSLAPAEYMPPKYWEARSHMAYYAAIRELVESLSPGASILDVGGYDTPVVTWGTFKRRYTVDAVLDPKFPGVKSTEKMDVVICAQVLEHLENGTVERFARKLRQTGRTTIVSVPYCWPAGGEPSHVQDPIDIPKLARIMGGRPDRCRLVADGKRRRIVALWNN